MPLQNSGFIFIRFMSVLGFISFVILNIRVALIGVIALSRKL